MFSFDPQDPFSWLIYFIFGASIYWPITIAVVMGFIAGAILQKKWMIWLFGVPSFALVTAIFIFFSLGAIKSLAWYWFRGMLRLVSRYHLSKRNPACLIAMKTDRWERPATIHALELTAQGDAITAPDSTPCLTSEPQLALTIIYIFRIDGFYLFLSKHCVCILSNYNFKLSWT